MLLMPCLLVSVIFICWNKAWLRVVPGKQFYKHPQHTKKKKKTPVMIQASLLSLAGTAATIKHNASSQRSGRRVVTVNPLRCDVMWCKDGGARASRARGEPCNIPMRRTRPPQQSIVICVATTGRQLSNIWLFGYPMENAIKEIGYSDNKTNPKTNHSWLKVLKTKERISTEWETVKWFSFFWY